MKISVVIPVFNELNSLPQLIDELKENLKKSYNNWEVIFIDDGSSDKSNEWLLDLSCKNNNFKLIQFYKYGKSAALSEGFKNAKGDYVITMDLVTR